jgi:hypothetical protein
MACLPLLVEIVGWTGAVLVLIGFALVSAGRIEARGALFQWLNLLGAAGFVVNSGWHGAVPSFVLNIIWCAIAAVALLRLRLG